MEKNATSVCFHDFTGFLGELQEHFIELKIQAD
jgi:hypothetical protein